LGIDAATHVILFWGTLLVSYIVLYAFPFKFLCRRS